jgi:hypothetical protein
MNKVITLAAIVGCAALSACGGGASEDTVNTDNSMMIDNLGTTDMNMDANMDMNATDMNATDSMPTNSADSMNTSGDAL